MCRNDKNMLKAVAIFVTALIVFAAMNYNHNIIHSRMIKYNTQKQIDKHKEDSCSYYIVHDVACDSDIYF